MRLLLRRSVSAEMGMGFGLASLSWMVFFLSLFFVGAGMIYAAFFFMHWFKERRAQHADTFGDVTYYVPIGSD
jgi:hypothetical protein